MKEKDRFEQVAPVPLGDGERVLWQGRPVAPPRLPVRSAHLVVTLASAFGFWAYWMMVPELPLLRIALVFPIVALLAMAAYPLLVSRRRANVFFRSARYTLTNKRAISAHRERTVEITLTPRTRTHVTAGPKAVLSLWNTGKNGREGPVYFHQLENVEEPCKVVRNILESP